MRAIYAKFVKFGAKLRAFLPSRIPTEKADFEAWVVSTLDLFEIKDTPVYRNAIFTLIMHMGNTQNHKAKYQFAKALRRAQLQETTYEALERLRAEDKRNKQAVAALTEVSDPNLAQTEKAQG